MIVLILLSIAMFSASYGLGSIPIHIQFSEAAIALMSIASTGVLISSALAIIIPEGCEVIYSSSLDHGAVESEASHPTAERYIGLAIVLGFVFMFLIEQFSEHIHSKIVKVSYVAVDNLHELQEHRLESGSLEDDTDSRTKKALSSTLGLCIHSFADGIALGSSAHTSASVNLIVFVAILLHKGPAAFSLAAILLDSGLTRRQVKLHLASFALAAPVGALLTYIGIAWIGLGTGVSHISSSTGLVLLFSGGTFLFVAVSHAPREKLAPTSVLSMVAGLCLPVFISVLVSHGH